MLIGLAVLPVLLVQRGTLSPAKPGTLTYGPFFDIRAASIAIYGNHFGQFNGLGRREIALAMASALTGTTEDDNSPLMRERVQDPARVAKAFQAAAAVNLDALPAVPYDGGTWVTMVMEDIGFADFHQLAFGLFGVHPDSTQRLDFSVVWLSMLLFIAAYWRSLGLAPARALVLGALLTSTSQYWAWPFPCGGAQVPGDVDAAAGAPPPPAGWATGCAGSSWPRPYCRPWYLRSSWGRDRRRLDGSCRRYRPVGDSRGRLVSRRIRDGKRDGPVIEWMAATPGVLRLAVAAALILGAVSTWSRGPR